MKIFLAGATGAIGQPLVTRLLADRHEVFGMTRSHKRAQEMKDLGAVPILADALDADSVLEAVKNARPEVVIEMLTSLPKVYTPESMREAAARDTEVRTVGGSNLQSAAQAVGVRRYIIQSSAFCYTAGSGLASEETPFAFDAPSGIAANARIYSEVENRVLNANNLEGIALRFGFFYGPGTWFAVDGDMADQVRQRRYYIAGGGQGVWNFVHIEDAASSIALALNCAPGAYNITNDTPEKLSVLLPAFARWLNASAPPERTSDEELRINGPESVYYATQLRGASNAKAKQTLGFRPRPLEWLES